MYYVKVDAHTHTKGLLILIWNLKLEITHSLSISLKSEPDQNISTDSRDFLVISMGPAKTNGQHNVNPNRPSKKKKHQKKQVLGTTRSAHRGGFQISSRTSILQMQTRLRSCWGWLGSCFGRKAICSWSCPLALWSRGERCRSSKCSCTRFCRACGPTPKTENNRQKTSYWSDLVA